MKTIHHKSFAALILGALVAWTQVMPGEAMAQSPVPSGDPFRVIGIVMNDATRDNADEPLAIVARKDSGIRPGHIEDLKGKRVGLAQAQTSDEYFK